MIRAIHSLLLGLSLWCAQAQAASGDVILHCSGAACAPQVKSLIEEWNKQSSASQVQRCLPNRRSPCHRPNPYQAKEPATAPPPPLNPGAGSKGVSR